MSRLTGPPACVPTLTEVVHPSSVFESASSRAAAPEDAEPETQALQVQRVLQRMDLTLDKHLESAMEQLIQTHVQALMPHLREAIERAVREAVVDALRPESTLSCAHSGTRPVVGA
jgi:hypothetical protein